MRVITKQECCNILRRFALGHEKHLERLVTRFDSYNGHTIEVNDVIEKLCGYAPPFIYEQEFE